MPLLMVGSHAVNQIGRKPISAVGHADLNVKDGTDLAHVYGSMVGLAALTADFDRTQWLFVVGF